MRRKDRLTHKERGNGWDMKQPAAEQQTRGRKFYCEHLYLNDIYISLYYPTQAIPGNDIISVVLRKSNVAFSMLDEIKRVLCGGGGTEIGE